MIKKITYHVLFLLIIFPSILYAKVETAIFAGGCFWCMESDFNHLKEAKYPNGVLDVISGYDGGIMKDPTYDYVSSGQSNYKEVVKITFNPEKVSYKTLVEFFFLHIDPTVKNKQFCDIGRQYASAIYYTDEKQKQVAENILNKVKNILKKPIYTEILPTTTFYEAEDYHQNYYKKNPIRYKYYRWRCGRDQTLENVWQGKSIS